ncbi:Yip1 family protein [Halobaculum sp. MBLA0143]|uniref:Yip1 family protein n=1 Tax=Halobaculum sp. MBLA0143 TaxID=3079933 RepID=UPI0035262B6F
MSYLTDPDEFFAQRADDPDWLLPVLLVFSAGFLPAIGSWYAIQQIFSGGGVGIIVAVFGSAGALVGVFLLWIVGAAVFHGVSAVFDGEGSFWRTLWLSGWGYVPSVIAGGATMVALLLAASTLPPATTGQEFVQVNMQLQTHQYVQWASYFGLVMSVWQGVIWAFAVRHARGLELREGAIAVAPFVLANLGLTLRGLL